VPDHSGSEEGESSGSGDSAGSDGQRGGTTEDHVDGVLELLEELVSVAGAVATSAVVIRAVVGALSDHGVDLESLVAKPVVLAVSALALTVMLVVTVVIHGLALALATLVTVEASGATVLHVLVIFLLFISVVLVVVAILSAASISHHAHELAGVLAEHLDHLLGHVELVVLDHDVLLDLRIDHHVATGHGVVHAGHGVVHAGHGVAREAGGSGVLSGGRGGEESDSCAELHLAC